MKKHTIDRAGWRVGGLATAIMLVGIAFAEPEKSPLGAAKWIGINGETSTTWKLEDRIQAMGIDTSVKGHYCPIAHPLPKICPRLRKQFKLAKKPVKSAVVRVVGKGFYELWLDGEKVDATRVLAPAAMSRNIQQYDTYEVGERVREGGEHTLGIWLAAGYSDDFSRYGWEWLAPMRAILEMKVTYVDGTTDEVVTDGSWQSTEQSPLLYASIYHGEVYNASAEDAGWAKNAGSTSNWRPVCVFSDGPKLVASLTPPIRQDEVHRPIKILRTRQAYIVDFGQNLAGVVRIRARGARGHRITIRLAEDLSEDAKSLDFYTIRGAEATDTFILAGTGEMEEYTPRFTYHGFRYAEISNYPRNIQLTENDIESIAVHADVKPTSSFKCSDETLMKIHNAANWSMLSNLMSFPTDCCMRDERTRCLMDSQAYEDAACQFFDMRDYYAGFLRSLGSISGGNPDWNGEPNSLVWRLWHYYGDYGRLESGYPAVTNFVRQGLKEHPDYLFEKGYGDWCAPNGGLKWEGFFREPALVNTAIFAQILGMAAELAADLGKTEEAAEYRRHLAAAKAAFHAKFYDAGKGVYSDGNQTAMVLPLAFDLVPAGERVRVAANLVKRIREHDRLAVDVGIYGNRYLWELLCDLGEADLAMEMLGRKEYPSYGYCFSRGATTMWEQWEYTGNMHSHNHAMKSGGACWLYTRLAGIRAAKPGYAAILVKPVFPKALTFVEATRETPHGKIAVKWNRVGDGISFEATIPEGVPAELELPDGSRHQLAAGVNRLQVK